MQACKNPFYRTQTTKYQTEILLKHNKNFDDDLRTSHIDTIAPKKSN